MKKVLACMVSVLLVLSLLAACGGSASAPQSAGSDDNAQNAAEQAGGTDEAEGAAQDSAPDASESAPESSEGSEPEEPAVTLTFDPHAYRHTNDDNYYVGLLYATNRSDGPVEAAFRYTVFDADGNVMSAFDPWTGSYREEFRTSVFIPAGAEDLPIGFLMALGLAYDLNKGEEMPEIGRVEYEFLTSREETTEDLRAHFAPGEYYIQNGHLYYPVVPDEEITERFASVYADYTILGYSGDELVAVCCRNDFPYGSPWSVEYAVENNDGAFMAYHNVPYGITIDTWVMVLGCFSAGE